MTGIISLKTKKFSVVVALYNVENYVDAFFKSLKNQSCGLDALEVVVINDGSTDGSLDIAARWAKRFPQSIKVLSKENGGPGSARNFGLNNVGGEWVTFCDPDDILHPEYFEEVKKFLGRDGGNNLKFLATRLVEHEDGSIRTSHTHPLDWKFRHGNRVVDLRDQPNHVHLSGGTSFFLRSVIESVKLRFDERIRPKFEDAHFIGRYFAILDVPLMGIIASARYFYRKRSNGSSLVQGTWSDPRAYDEVLRIGYLGLLQAATTSTGQVPRWAQYMVLYDLVWLSIADRSMHSGTATVTPALKRVAHENLDRIMDLIETESIHDFAAVSQGWIFHNMLQFHYKLPKEQNPVVIDWKTNYDRQTKKYSYMFNGNLPSERFVVDGTVCTPVAIKTIAHSLLGSVLVWERVIVLPVGNALVYLDGERARITRRWDVPQRGNFLSSDDANKYLNSVVPVPSRQDSNQIFVRGYGRISKFLSVSLSKLKLQGLLSQDSLLEAGWHVALRFVTRKVTRLSGRSASKRDLSIIASARKLDVSVRYHDAWVLMDRIDRGDDNAEHLYRYLAAQRPDINIWFLLKKSSPDWKRLKSEGFRLVAYGSDEAVRLLLNCKYKISSHADRDVQYPMDQRRFGRDNGKIVFLQHGVTKDDLSRWINGKQISLMITASKDEYSSLVGDGTPYKWTTDEIVVTGFPRHDLLMKKTLNSPSSSRSQILIAPTWRQYMSVRLSQLSKASDRREYFESTEYGNAWLGLLRSPILRDLAQNYNLKIVFLAHPNISGVMQGIGLPPFISCVDYSDISIQDEIALSAVAISDFASLVFDAAFAGSNVIHFQFDGDEIYKGGHVYRKGYFDYETHGLGPQVTSIPEVLDVLGSMAENRFIRSSVFEERVARTFAYLDSRASERVVEAIEELARPVKVCRN